MTRIKNLGYVLQFLEKIKVFPSTCLQYNFILVCDHEFSHTRSNQDQSILYSWKELKYILYSSQPTPLSSQPTPLSSQPTPLSSQPTPSVPSQPPQFPTNPPVPSQPPQFPANPPSEWLGLQGIHLSGCFYSPPPPPGDQEGCIMTGRGQPPSAARPGHFSPLLPGVRRRSEAPAAAQLPPPPTASSQHAPPPATVVKNMFSTCVGRGKAAKLVYRTVGGKVETSLYWSTATPAAEAASVIPKWGRMQPDNERRRMRREAWQKRNAGQVQQQQQQQLLQHLVRLSV